MAQTKARIAEQLQASTSARSILITDGSSKPSYHAPTTGADTILFWDDSASNWQPLTVGTNLSISGTTLNASAGAGGYAEVQEEGTAVTARTKINFVGSAATAADDAGNTRTNVTFATILNNIATTGSVDLDAHVSNTLPFANIDTLAALSVLGNSTNATATMAAITAASDNQVLRRSGTAIGFGAINLASTAAVTGTLAATNGGTGFASYTVGDILAANTTTSLSKVAAVASGSVLKSAGTGTLPVWGTLASTDLTNSANIAMLNENETVSGSWTFSNVIVNNVTPTLSTHLVNKAYVDGLIANQRKTSVRVATTTNGTLATAFANGQTVDGITLVTGDRILLKDQSTQAQNGVYTVNASGAPTRATDMDAASEVDGTFIVVEDGTTNAGTIWVTTSEVTTLDTDAIVWTQINKATDLVAGNGLTLTGLTLAVTNADGSITVGSDTVSVALATNSGLELSTGLRVKSDTVSSNTIGVTRTTNGIGILFDGNSFADAGSETLALASGVAGAGLALTTGVLSVNVDASTIEINTDTLRVKDAGITYAKIQNVTEDRLLGRDAGSSGVVQEISLGAGLTFNNSATLAHSDTSTFAGLDTTGAQIIDVVTVDTFGHVTAITTRNIVLDDINDVAITSLATSDVLQYNGTNWVNAAISSGTITVVYVEGSTASTIDLDANAGVVKDRDGNNASLTIPTDRSKFEVYRNGILQAESGGAPGNTTRDYSVNTTTHVLTLSYALTSDEILVIKKFA